MEALRKALQTHPFMSAFSQEEIQALLPLAKFTSFRENQTVFKQGQNADKFYLVISGLINVGIDPKIHGILSIQQVTDGEALGWSWLIPPYIWQYDAIAIENTKCIEINAVQLRQLFEKDHKFGYHFSRQVLQVVSRRLTATRIQFWDLYKMHYLIEHNK
jgi:signal-transduction protein with cAMP-binding, CBS, and nucleotidyltransferase domain